jgi:hypothetical protein
MDGRPREPAIPGAGKAPEPFVLVPGTAHP